MTAADIADLKRIFKAAAPNGVLPDLGSNVLVKRVIVDPEANQVVMAALARVEVMAHLYVDHEWSTPMMRRAALELLHREMRLELREKSIEHAHAELEQARFGRRLVDELGWRRPELVQYVLEI